MLRQANWKTDNRRSSIRTSGDGLLFWNREWNKPGDHKLVRLTYHKHLHISFYNYVNAIYNIFSSEKCESVNGWMIGFFVTLAVLLLAFTAAVLVMKNKRCQDKRARYKKICWECKFEKFKFIIRSTVRIDTDSFYIFVFFAAPFYSLGIDQRRSREFNTSLHWSKVETNIFIY